MASFDVTKINDGTFVPSSAPFSGWDHEFSAGADFGAFILVDPVTKARYHPLKMDTEFVENYVPALDGGETGRAYVYYPAPPDDRTSITLEVASGGVYPAVPIKGWPARRPGDGTRPRRAPPAQRSTPQRGRKAAGQRPHRADPGRPRSAGPPMSHACHR
ncbi:hypothetical protein [Nonomuraea zeae]|uniref:hypothetical protein n=1 Tax=Nonomuraea zeae TaxID=1642303 RepID=UPI00110A0C36|nr:hypothetical protein [Nonomuraea zeae]